MFRCCENTNYIPRFIANALQYLVAIGCLIYSLYLLNISGDEKEMHSVFILCLFQIVVSAYQLFSYTYNYLKYRHAIMLNLLTGIVCVITTLIYSKWYITVGIAISYLIILVLHINICCDVKGTFYKDPVINLEIPVEENDIEMAIDRVIVIQEPNQTTDLGVAD